MSTNYYRIPSVDEVNTKHKILLDKIRKLDLSPYSIERKFETIEDNTQDFNYTNPWSIFVDDLNIHLGKRSSGWLFLWNFNDKRFYSNKEELFAFIKSGRVVDEYGTEMPVDEFIDMALNWGQPNGKYLNEQYYIDNYDNKNIPRPFYVSRSEYDKLIDGLRVSKHTDFC